LPEPTVIGSGKGRRVEFFYRPLIDQAASDSMRSMKRSIASLMISL